MRARRSAVLAACVLAAIGASSARSREAGPSAELRAGIEAYNAGDFVTARRLLTEAAGRGEPEAMVNYGYMLARGHGVRPNSAMALLFYRQAAALGDAEGMNAIGYRYRFAAPPDFANALLWYCRAVAGGNPRGMNNLANLVYNGEGVAKDPAEARSLWRQAVALGSVTAAANLGFSLSFDPGLSQAERTAGTDLLRQAARRGNGGAQAALRRSGDTEAFPPAIDTTLPMALEPRPAVPGTSRVCGDLVS